MTYLKQLTSTLMPLLLAGPLMAQTPPADPQATPPSSSPPVWSVGGIDFSGTIDGNYSLNFNHPASLTNNLRNFDTRANQFSLNMATLSLSHTPDPVGFRMDLGFGRAMEVLHGAETAPDLWRHIPQAYVSLKPLKDKGLQLDFGKFYTSAGAEPTETYLNWNYSRSLLFSWACPYYHFGARASMPVTDYFTAGASLTNGWNNVDDNNSGKTVGLTGALTHSKIGWANTYYVGREKPGQAKGLRHLYDTVVTLTPHEQFSAYFNFDYGKDTSPGNPSAVWVGVAGAARYAPVGWFALSPRMEWFDDQDGFNTGTAQKLKEFTLTGEFKMAEGILTRLEYRRDWSDQPFFDRGNSLGTHKSQSTILIGLVAFFGPNR